MPFLAMNVGALLIALGCVGYFVPDFLGTGDKYKVTALIPAGFGLALELCGALSLSNKGMRKLLMHLAVVVSTVGIVGGFFPMVTRKFDFSQAAVISGAAMTAICLIFTLLCVRSFVRARKAK